MCRALPVEILRFTHHTINADTAFGDDHDNRQESILKPFDSFFAVCCSPVRLSRTACDRYAKPDRHSEISNGAMEDLKSRPQVEEARQTKRISTAHGKI